MDRPADDEPATGRAAPAEDDAFSGLPIPAKGTLLLGKYRVEGVVGIGGMGMVLAARHEHLNERVALKLLLPRYAELTETRKRFQREAQAAYKLRSEHVCRVLDAGDLEDGTPFIAMEYLKGDDLSAVLRRKKRIPIPEAVDYLLQACEALGEAHANDIVHRDLKPGNLVIVTRKDGTRCLKVIDFGISKVATETSSDLTNTFGYLGSPSYSAPEQFASTRAMTASGDLWSLGVILYEMVSGSSPFDFSSDGLAEMAAVIVHEPAIPLSRRDPSMDPRFAQIVMRCLEKEPADRFPRVRELAEALAPYASTAPDDLLGRLRRHQPGASQMGPARAATPQRNGPRTEATPAPVVRGPSTVALESGPALVARGSSDHAMHAMPPMQHGYSQPPAPMPSAPGMPSSPSLPPMPMMTNGPGAPPVTRYAVSADPITNAGPAASRAAWVPAAFAAFAVLATLAGGLAYRAAHRPAPAAVEPPPVATLEPVPVPVGAPATIITTATAAAAVAPTASAAGAAEAATASTSAPTTRPGASPRPPPTARGSVRGPAAATSADPASPKILRDRDGKF
jgi:eukaryotic-like serine/threonine-protein kinase